MRILILLLLLAVPASADIRSDVEFLSSDALQGRASRPINDKRISQNKIVTLPGGEGRGHPERQATTQQGTTPDEFTSIQLPIQTHVRLNYV